MKRKQPRAVSRVDAITWFSSAEAAKLLCVTSRHVRTLAAAGELVSDERRGKLYVSQESVRKRLREKGPGSRRSSAPMTLAPFAMVPSKHLIELEAELLNGPVREFLEAEVQCREAMQKLSTALANIRRRELFRPAYGSFEEYVVARFGITSERANALADDPLAITWNAGDFPMILHAYFPNILDDEIQHRLRSLG
jgi:hypothetical protein